MHIWFDMLTPKHVILFHTIAEKLKPKIKATFTTRNYDCNLDLMRDLHIPTKTIGVHGGGTLEGKLIESAKRLLKLSEFVIKDKPDFVIHFSSPEAARISFGLGIKSICLNDTSHATAVTKLTAPLSDYLIAPQHIQSDWIKRVKAWGTNVILYNGVDEVEWTKTFKSNIQYIKSVIDVDFDRPIVLFRPEEEKASYMITNSNRVPKYIKIIKGIIKKVPSAQIIAFPRYEDQRIKLAEFKDNVIIPDHCLVAAHLISFASVVITGGGTMARESALLGTPAISFFNRSTIFQNYLKNMGFPFEQIVDENRVISRVNEILKNPDAFKVDTGELLSKLESPSDKIKQIIFN